MAKAARQHLRVRLRSDGRRRRREEIFARSVTARRSATPTLEDEAAVGELAAASRPRIARTPQEAAALALWLDGVADPAGVAAQLGLAPADATTLMARLRQRYTANAADRPT